MNTIRDSIPVEKVLRAYMDETEEQDVEVEEKEEVIPVEVEKEVPVEPVVPSSTEQLADEVQQGQIQQTQSQAQPQVPQVPQVEEGLTNKVIETEGNNQTPFKLDDLEDTNDSLFEPEKKQIIGFNNMDSVMSDEGVESHVSAPKNIQRLEEISRVNNERRKMEEEDDDDYSDDESETLSIGGDIDLNAMEIEDLEPKKNVPSPSLKLNTEPLLTDIEVLH